MNSEIWRSIKGKIVKVISVNRLQTLFVVLLILGIGSFIFGCQPSTPPPATILPETATPSAVMALLPTLAPQFTLTPIPLLPTITSMPTSPPVASPTPKSTLQSAAITPEKPTPSVPVHLAAVGDIMLDRTLGQIIVDGRLDYPFAKMKEELVSPDLTIGNLESALGDLGIPQEGKTYPFRSPPAAAAALALGGFDVVSLANNHAMDYGPEALLQGIDLLRAAGVVPVGAGANRAAAHAPAILEVNGQRLAFLAYVNVPVEQGGFDVEMWDATATNPGLAWGRPDEIAADIEAVLPEVDHVIVLLHSGLEYVRFTGDVQRELARRAIDAGATVVIGHHAHILQGIERYGDGLIAYGLGNFAFDINGEPDTAVLHIWLHPDGRIDYELRPAVIQVGGAPRPATAEEAAAILENIKEFVPRPVSVEE